MSKTPSKVSALRIYNVFEECFVLCHIIVYEESASKIGLMGSSTKLYVEFLSLTIWFDFGFISLLLCVFSILCVYV